MVGQNSSRPIATTDGSSSAYGDRKSTRLNSSHSQISYAVFCLKKKELEDVVGETALDVEEGEADRGAPALQSRQARRVEEDSRSVGARRRHPRARAPHRAGALLVDPEPLSSEQGRQPGEQAQRVPYGSPHTFASGRLYERW